MMPNRKETYLANERMSLLYEAANNLTDLLSIQIQSEMIQLYTKTLFFSIYIIEYNCPFHFIFRFNVQPLSFPKSQSHCSTYNIVFWCPPIKPLKQNYGYIGS